MVEKEFTKEELEYKLKEAKERLEKYEGYKKYMEENNLSQLSLTDKDSKLMKAKDGFIVGYNVQTAIDSNTHLITDYNVTNRTTDYGLIESTASKLKEEQYKDKPMEVVADKGYDKKEDIINCLKKGIIPNIINNKGNYKIEIDYKNSECDIKSTDAKEISKCLHNGVIPEVYKNNIKDIKITKGVTKVNNRTKKNNKEFKNKEEMLEKAKEGYFVRDVESNLVYCPNGETLRQAAVKSNGNIRYRNIFVCKHCLYRYKCFSGKVKCKEIDFTKDTIIKPARWKSIFETKINDKIDEKKCKIIKTEKVKFTFITDKEKMAQRFSLSEHPFGTIKRTLNGASFLLRRQVKVDAEFALLSLSYNLQRTINMLGFNKVMQLVRT